MEFLKILPELARHKYKIDYVSGDFILTVNDYAQSDILNDFVITRTYHSLTGEWKFNIAGRPRKITLKTTRTISLTYEKTKLVAVKDELGRTTKYDYEGNFLKCVTYPDGSKVRYFPDFDKKIISCSEREGKNIFQNEYDDIGRIVEFSNDEGKKYFFYDVQRRRTIENGDSETEIIYKWNRRQLIEDILYSDGTAEHFIYDDGDRVNYKLGRDGGEHFYRYRHGLLRREIFPDGSIISFEYDDNANLVRKNESNGRETIYHYSSKNLLIEKDVRLNVKDWRIETWERDMHGRVLQYSVNDQITNYAYDEDAPFPSLVKTPCGYKFSYRYDKAYKLLAMRTEVGEYLFTYNQLNELVEEQNIFAEVELPEKNLPKTNFDIFDEGGRQIESREAVGDKFKLTRWKYDKNDNCIERREWERLQDRFSATGRVKLIKYEYDQQNRLTKKIEGDTFIEYTYDCLNRCVREKFKQSNKPAKIKKIFYNLVGEIISTKEYEVR